MRIKRTGLLSGLWLHFCPAAYALNRYLPILFSNFDINFQFILQLQIIRHWRTFLKRKTLLNGILRNIHPPSGGLIQKLISDKEYHLLQLQLSVRPESGDIIKGSGGIRKIRWSGSGRGKRGGIRVIYYYFTEDEQVYMLYAYPKSKKDDLTADQLMQLKQLVEDQLS
jgi:hypothetical protein